MRGPGPGDVSRSGQQLAVPAISEFRAPMQGQVARTVFAVSVLGDGADGGALRPIGI